MQENPHLQGDEAPAAQATPNAASIAAPLNATPDGHACATPADATPRLDSVLAAVQAADTAAAPPKTRATRTAARAGHGKPAAAHADARTDAPAAPEADAGADSDAQADNAFAALGLAPELLAAVRDLGFSAPTQVQQRAIPLALAAPEQAHPFNDLMVSSQTGSGKTAAFLLPVLHTLLEMKRQAAEQERAQWQARLDAALAAGEPPPKKPRRKNPADARHFKPAVPGALVLCPTRELAQQVAADAIDLVKHCRGVRIANIVGGMPYNVQIARLQNADLVVATPGRLLDLHRGGQIQLDKVRFLVLDEADRMLDLGFADDLEQVHHLTAARQQTMMFSATFAPRIQQLAMRVMHEGGARVHRIEVATPQQRHEHITQALYWADDARHKRQLLDHWLRDASIEQAIVFACTQVECEQLADDLQQAGFAAVSLHGALSQGLRNRRLNALRGGRVQILVATDVAARGIDVPAITHVINFGLPMKAEDYTHRIGRTGRAGREGLAVTLAEIHDRRRLAAIEAHTRQPLAVKTIEGLEPTKHFPPISQRPPFGARAGKNGKGGRGGNKGGNWDRPDRFAPRRGPRMAGDFGERFNGRLDSESGFGRGGERPVRDDFARGRPGGRGDSRFGARHDGGFNDRFNDGFGNGFDRRTAPPRALSGNGGRFGKAGNQPFAPRQQPRQPSSWQQRDGRFERDNRFDGGRRGDFRTDDRESRRDFHDRRSQPAGGRPGAGNASFSPRSAGGKPYAPRGH